ncbi:MAG: CpsD/CapB family tyrosine-protein kinase [Steroidobacteraceae bacterium]
MSIIERSLQKMATSNAEAAANNRRTPRAQTAPQPNAPATPAVPATEFRKIQLDPPTLESNRILAGIADPVAMSAYKMLRTRVLQRTSQNGWRNLGVTGTLAGEGKSLTAINLALALARDVNTHVFLVDMDLQRPSVATQLGMNFDKGLSDYLVGNASREEIIYSPGIDRFAVIPNANRGNHHSELLGSPRMDELMASLTQEAPARIVIYDLPPLLVSDDVLSIAPRLDAMLLVATQGITERKVLESAREILAEVNLLGVVLNRSTEHEKRSYGYEYHAT